MDVALVGAGMYILTCSRVGLGASSRYSARKCCHSELIKRITNTFIFFFSLSLSRFQLPREVVVVGILLVCDD